MGCPEIIAADLSDTHGGLCVIAAERWQSVTLDLTLTRRQTAQGHDSVGKEMLGWDRVQSSLIAGSAQEPDPRTHDPRRR